VLGAVVLKQPLDHRGKGDGIDVHEQQHHLDDAFDQIVQHLPFLEKAAEQKRLHRSRHEREHEFPEQKREHADDGDAENHRQIEASGSGLGWFTLFLGEHFRRIIQVERPFGAGFNDRDNAPDKRNFFERDDPAAVVARNFKKFDLIGAFSANGRDVDGPAGKHDAFDDRLSAVRRANGLRQRGHSSPRSGSFTILLF